MKAFAPVCGAVLFTAGLTAQTQGYVPMTERERAVQYVKDTFNPMYLVTASAAAGIGQWRDAPPAWKQGGEGFARRFGSAYAQHITSTTLMFGASSLLHEDNRYVPSDQSGVKARIGYALKNTFVARHDDGSPHVSISKISAMAGASLISRSWQPIRSDRWRSAGLNFGVSVGWAMGFGVAREFLPVRWRRK